MIIGQGLMAKSLSKHDREDTLFFCSGVSNSLETDPREFKREIDLLNSQDNSLTLVYFSTISIYNPNKSASPYILHKLAVEERIRHQFPKYIIMRLPNMVGTGGNASNLFPYFLNAIKSDNEVVIYKDTHRDLLDVRDVGPILNHLLNSGYCGTLDVCFDNPPSALDLYLHMCNLTGKKPRYKLLPGENPFSVNNKQFMALLKESEIDCKTDWREIVNSYVLVQQAHFS